MSEALFAGILLIAIVMTLTAMLASIRAVTRDTSHAPGNPAATPRASDVEEEVYACKVLSSRTVAPLLRELILALPEGRRIEFKPGNWVEVTAPPYTLSFSDYALTAEHRAVWDRMGIWGLSVSSARRESRPYWIANTVEDGGEWLVLLVRLALPPPDRPELPPGKVSSWLFGLRAGDVVEVRGPFGKAAVPDGEDELVLIGAAHGMAPIRAILSAQLAGKGTKRPIRLWYGARNQAELVYRDELDRLAAAHPNFIWSAALTDPAADGTPAGFLHDRIRRDFLEMHPGPEDCLYLVYGPPLMTRSVVAMLEDFGVDADRIRVGGAESREVARAGGEP